MSLSGSQRPNHDISLLSLDTPTPDLVGKALHLVSFPGRCTSHTRTWSSTQRDLPPCQLTKLVKQADHILLCESGGTTPSCYYKASIPQPLLVHSGPKCNSHVALYGIRCLPAPGWEYMWLRNCCQFHLSSAGCHVFHHLILFSTEDPSFTNSEQEVVRTGK